MKRVLIPFIAILAILVSVMAMAMEPDPSVVPFDEAVKQLNTPEKLNAWMREHISFGKDRYKECVNFSKTYGKKDHLEDGDFWKKCQYPSETYAKQSGVCFDYANFATYCLKQAGYDARMLAVHYGKYSYAGTKLKVHTHAICAVRVEDGWLAVGATQKGSTIRPIEKYRNFKEVLQGPLYGKYYKIKFIFDYYYKMEGQESQKQWRKWSVKEYMEETIH